jgi:hypothetical protein
MNRRLFLTLAGAGTALAAIPGMAFISAPYEKSVKGLILKELSYLKIDEAGLEQFVQDFSISKNNDYRLKIRGLYIARIKANQSRTVEDLVKAYLLSTDFFSNKMDEQKTVNYLGLYDPYKRPCANPFSFIYFPAQAS